MNGTTQKHASLPWHMGWVVRFQPDPG